MNYTGCKVQMIVNDSSAQFEEDLNRFLREMGNHGYTVYDIKYHHSMSYHRPTTYSAMIIYSTL